MAHIKVAVFSPTEKDAEEMLTQHFGYAYCISSHMNNWNVDKIDVEGFISQEGEYIDASWFGWTGFAYTGEDCKKLFRYMLKAYMKKAVSAKLTLTVADCHI